MLNEWQKRLEALLVQVDGITLDDIDWDMSGAAIVWRSFVTYYMIDAAYTKPLWRVGKYSEEVDDEFIWYAYLEMNDPDTFVAFMEDMLG